MKTATLALSIVILSSMAVTGGAAGVRVPPPGSSSRVDAIRERGSLRVAVLAEYPWLEQGRDEASEHFSGPAWRLVQEYAARLGVRVEAVPVGFAEKVQVASSDRVDMTAAPLLDTPVREEVVDFVNYSISAQCLFGLSDDARIRRAATVDDLDRPDVKIAYVAGTPTEAWLPERLPKAARLSVPGSNGDVPVDEILSGRADVAPIDKFFFAGLAKRVPGLVTLPRGDACLASREMAIPVGLAVAKGQSAFLSWMRAVAEEIKPEVQTEEARIVAAGE